MELDEALDVLKTQFGFVVGLDLSLTRAYIRCYEPPVPKHFRLTPPRIIVWRDLAAGSEWQIETAHPQRMEILVALNGNRRQPDPWNDPYF